MEVPFFDLKRQYQSIADEVEDAVLRVLKSTRYILGEEVLKLEESVAGLTGNRFAVGVSSGTDALLLSLMAMGLKEGDEVITTSFSFIASANVIVRAGGVPVFADIKEDTWCIDPSDVEKKITAKTKCVIAVDIFGNSSDLKKLRQICDEKGIFLIVDAAQSFGTTLFEKHTTSYGDFGCYSFFPTKNLGGAGDGGMVVTNNSDFYQKLIRLRSHGGEKKTYSYPEIGGNFRLDELQAAILNVKIRHISEWIKKRRKTALFYEESFKGLPLKIQKPEEGCYHTYNQFSVAYDHRDRLRDFLLKNGVQTRVYYPVPLNLQPCFERFEKFSCKRSEKLSKTVLSLPVFPELTEEEAEHVAGTLLKFFNDFKKN